MLKANIIIQSSVNGVWLRKLQMQHMKEDVMHNDDYILC